MDAWTSSIIVGFMMGTSLVWLVSLLNDRSITREKDLSRLVVKRGKRE